MAKFIFYRMTRASNLNISGATDLRYHIIGSGATVPWFCLAEYAAMGGYFKAASIEASSLHEAWDNAHTDHLPTAKYVKTLSKECPGYSSVGDVFEDCSTGELWLCQDMGWAEMPDDVAVLFKKALEPVRSSEDLRSIMSSLAEDAA